LPHTPAARRVRHARGLRWAACVVLLLVTAVVPTAGLGAADDASQAATGLRARYTELQDRLRDSAFGLALYVDSQQQPERLSGDLYGVINEPFATVRATLAERPQWCELLLLHINVKDCRTSTVERQDGIVLQLGGKNDVGGEGGTHLDYRFKVVASTADYLSIVLAADQRPFGPTDHRIALEATA